ncbi:MAG: hypothetical protein ACXVPN_11430 [Bacteroidia bacterium]
MELLERPKTIYLLEADMEVLHDESLEWLNEIQFWRDEIAFFYALMLKKAGKDSLFARKDEIGRIQEDLLSLSGKEFSDLETAINEHEKYLAALWEGDSSSNDRSFREKHKAILIKMQTFKSSLRKLKDEIFLLVKKESL